MARRVPCIANLAAFVWMALATTGCASGSYQTRLSTSGAQPYLSGSEIREGQYNSVYDAVRHLRPLFLNSRGPTSIREAPAHDILVIINDQAFGGVDELRAVPAAEVLWLRRLTASEVYYKLGRSAPSGGIEVRTLPCSPGC
jgi:hypothetical protein